MADGMDQSLSDGAYRVLRHKIVTLALEPGAVIDEAALRAELGVGRTPIREALQRLERDKLVQIVPRRGTFVTEIGIVDLQRLFELRLELERLAAQLAAKRGDERQWTRMARVLAGAEAAAKRGDTDALIEIDQRCHEIMYEAADNEFLADTLSNLYTLTLRLWYFALARVDDMGSSIAAHRALHQALSSGEVERAGELVEEHVRDFQERFETVMYGRVYR